MLAFADRRVTWPQASGLIDLFYLCRSRHAIFKFDSLCERIDGFVGNLSLDLRPVGLPQLVPGVGDAVLKLAVIGQYHQAFTVAVETAGGVDAFLLDVVSQCRPSLVIGELAEYIEGFV